MIPCDPNSIIPVDQRVIELLESHHPFRLDFDRHFLDTLESFHGGTPENPFVVDTNGREHQIGWFVSLIDEQSPISPPFQSATYYSDNDTRIDDRSLTAILGDDVCPYHFGKRIFPFAALYDNINPPTSLRLYTLDSIPDDSLCFDTSTNPHSIVYCNAEMAVDQAMKWEDEQADEYNYDFLIPVADSFVEFADKIFATSN